MVSRRALLVAGLASACTAGESWRGFRYFTAGDRSNPALVVSPVGPTGLGHWLRDVAIQTFTASGFYVVGAHWPGMDGGDEDFGARHREIAGWLDHLGLRKPMLYAQSRGALQLLNFACDHPNSFSRIAALYPVTDPFVFPGPNELLWDAYGVDPEDFRRKPNSPNLRAASLTGKPIKIWHGDSDLRAPKALTTDIFASSCDADVVTLRGVGHAWTDLTEIIAYLKGPV